MIVEDIVFSKQISLSEKDPYKRALHILNIVSDYGKVIERKNEFETDGPRQRCFVFFDIVDEIDSFTSYICKFDLAGEKSSAYGVLNVSMKFILRTNIPEKGFFSHLFSKYYITNILPFMRKEASNRMNQFIGKCKNIGLKTFSS